MGIPIHILFFVIVDNNLFLYLYSFNNVSGTSYLQQGSCIFLPFLSFLIFNFNYNSTKTAIFVFFLLFALTYCAANYFELHGGTTLGGGGGIVGGFISSERELSGFFSFSMFSK